MAFSPTDVRVKINDATVISALNTPGGEVNEWRNETEHKLLVRCFETSPVNNVENQMHRAKHGDPHTPGDFQRSWVTRRWGNGHRVGFNIENFADHAMYVEEGRRGSTKTQTFSWTEWDGDIETVGGGHNWSIGHGTGPRAGRHILRDATNRVLAETTGGAYTPLV